MYNKKLAAYRTQQLQSATSGEILLALYDGAIRYLGLAKRSMEGGHYAEKGAAIDRVLKIMTELEGSLDHQQAPELTENLRSLYTHIRQRVLVASSSLDPEVLEDVVKLLSPLREAWSEATRQSAAGSAEAPA